MPICLGGDNVEVMVLDIEAAQIYISQYLQRCSDTFYKWQAANRPSDDEFTVHDGPPYANGNLHVGHALNKILKDIILRVKVQQGRRVKYVPGWDCHGLPIELKALGTSGGKDMTPIEIRQAARDLASKTVLEQMKEFRSFAVMGDWEGRWTTMDRSYEINQLKLFQKMVHQGLIYRKFKPVYWSPSSGTALAEAELEYNEEHVSTAAFVKLPITGDAGKELVGSDFDGQLYAVIWTTTPWTLPANRAIAIHDELDYVIVRNGSDALIVAKTCLEAVSKACFEGAELEIMVQPFKGSLLRNLTYKNPLQGQIGSHQPIIHADFVSADSGSGLVHCAPGHGFEDYEVCMTLGIQVAAPVDNEGRFTKEAYPDDPARLEGASVQGEGNKAVLSLLGPHLLGSHKYKHKYPYDWRTKKPIIVRATAQWFADVATIKDDAMNALKDVRFIPDAGRNRIESFVRGRSEWCISRQRAWGVPIPALYTKDGSAILTEESVEHIISVIEERGIDAWWSDDANDQAWVPPSLRDHGEYRRGKDTMDVWFDSGSSWTQSDRQADVYLEGSDQHRGSLVEQTVGLSPFKNLITHGFTLDQDGKKMSKSLGNILVPEQVMDGTLLPPVKAKKKGGNAPPIKYDALGPDALRLWASSSDYTRDVVIGTPVLKSIHTALIKYRTIMKMLLGSMHESARSAPLTATDHIALIQLQDTMDEVGKAYDNFEFYKAFSHLNRWVNNDLSAFYLETLKDRLYCDDGGGILEPIFMGLTRMLAPITPMLVEEAWDHCPEWLKADLQVCSFSCKVSKLI
ncbi:putative isoleucyl-trna synthetase protein [Phaeoacremonium minimum UCRPA7]|uniref:Isoleucine--tRNA ligase, mitochondrial n=1 Tax=Phaeoacremonium minimum (strain UCR-PA7) TaxID=1286976 RepID=R8BH78_PHAM7|nr:putative isoleucyl-trna synthetase protein [Phaeoacremonium minimum UCRPA7]EON98592.1 putative isoleucyl-trna synthetase protein [Phaeoacremonium minimum UCRPA7]